MRQAASESKLKRTSVHLRFISQACVLTFFAQDLLEERSADCVWSSSFRVAFMEFANSEYALEDVTLSGWLDISVDSRFVRCGTFDRKSHANGPLPNQPAFILVGHFARRMPSRLWPLRHGRSDRYSFECQQVVRQTDVHVSFRLSQIQAL